MRLGATDFPERIERASISEIANSSTIPFCRVFSTRDRYSAAGSSRYVRQIITNHLSASYHSAAHIRSNINLRSKLDSAIDERLSVPKWSDCSPPETDTRRRIERRLLALAREYCSWRRSRTIALTRLLRWLVNIVREKFSRV